MSSPFDKPTIINPNYVKLLEEYLDKRCLTPNDFPAGLVPLDRREFLIERNYNATLAAGRPFIFLDYLDPHGKPYPGVDERGNPDPRNPFSVARFLGEPNLWRGDEPPPKVISQNGRANQLHFEPIPDLDGEKRTWHTLPKGQIVVHVESMIKAKAVSRWTGYPTVGLNGVASFHSSKRGVQLLHADTDVDFSQFVNVILFDSNTWKKPVAEAREQLAHKLKHLVGADVRLAELPKAPNGEDWGPDDFMRENGNEPLIQIIRDAAPYVGEEHGDLLEQIVDKLVYCVKSNSVIVREDKNVSTPDKTRTRFMNVNKKVLRRGATVTVEAFKLWIESKSRIDVVNPAYEYLGTEFIEKKDGVYYNLYKRGGYWPGEGDCSDIVAHLEKMFSPEDLTRVRSYLKFLKFSGKKPTSFPVLYSDKRGVGKGWLSKLAYRFIGPENCTSADARAFVSNFNAQLAHKRLVVVNEFKVKPNEKDAAMNSMKRFFGDEHIVIEPKGQDSYQLENRAGMIITANALEDVPTDGIEDRRMWYAEAHLVDGADDAYWNKLHSVIDQDGPMAAFASWVEQGEDTDFATWRPPLDEARLEAILASSQSIDSALIVLLRELKREDQNWVCVSYPLVLELLKREGIDTEKPVKTITAAMKRNGWVASEKKYGKTGSMAKVWIIDADKFSAMIDRGTEVNAEVKRATEYYVSSKY